MLFGHIVYDFAHYMQHHGSFADGTYAKKMKIYHLKHHYKQGKVGFGVTSETWDSVFGT